MAAFFSLLTVRCFPNALLAALLSWGFFMVILLLVHKHTVEATLLWALMVGYRYSFFVWVARIELRTSHLRGRRCAI